MITLEYNRSYRLRVSLGLHGVQSSSEGHALQQLLHVRCRRQVAMGNKRGTGPKHSLSKLQEITISVCVCVCVCVCACVCVCVC